jgi:hypothetical protein
MRLIDADKLSAYLSDWAYSECPADELGQLEVL